MTNGGGEMRLRLDMTSEQVEDFVYRLAEDDEFRSQLTADPVGVLGQYGIEVSPELLDVAGVDLPAKEEVRQAIEGARAGEFMRIKATVAGIFAIFCGLFAWPGLKRQ